jgi:hypothetical protein
VVGFLLDFIGHDLATAETGYCMQPTAFKQFDSKTGKYYWDWEKEIAEPALKAKGMEPISWYTGEGDSFGPLSRVVIVRGPDGKRSQYWYG